MLLMNHYFTSESKCSYSLLALTLNLREIERNLNIGIEILVHVNWMGI